MGNSASYFYGVRMLSNNEAKLIRSLHRKKGREKEKIFLVEGEKLVREALLFGEVLLVAGVREALEKLEVEPSLLRETQDRVMQKITSLQNHCGVLALVAMRNNTLDVNYTAEHFSLMIDGIRDPGNLGTIIRIADWFGIPQLLVSEDTVDVFNPKVTQASMGSIFRVRVVECDLAQCIAGCRTVSPEYEIAVTVLNGEDAIGSGWKSARAVVVGNEAFGVRNQLVTMADHKITIRGSGQAESLNAAVSCGIICHEWINLRN
ncbi:MAG: RNA methyltransferase [Salibacteraceae bacterium]